MAAVRTILLVENDPVTLEMYQNRLQREGFYVAIAQDGRAALKVLMETVVDLVILDLMLPKLNGAEVLNYMRMIPALEDVPVIVFSNAPETALAEETMARGPTKRLFKSECTFPTLLDTIHGMLGISADRSGDGARVSAEAPDASVSKTVSTGGADANAASTVATSADTNSEAIGEFLKNALMEMPKIREHCFAYIRAPGSPAAADHLSGFHQRVRAIGADAARLACPRISILVNALDALLAEMTTKRSGTTPSMLQTTAQAVDCLSLLLKSDSAALAEPISNISVLAVDDDLVCNRVMASTLKRANFDATTTDSPYSALKLLEIGYYDLILLDINMPGLTGFDVCNKLRRLPRYEATPVIFITAHNDFENRKQSVLSGGNDFIPKPIVPAELVLKLTVHRFNRQVQRRPAAQAEANVVTIDASQRALEGSGSNRQEQSARTETAVAALARDQRSAASPTPERSEVVRDGANDAGKVLETAAVATPAKLLSNPENQTVMSSETLPPTVHNETARPSAGSPRAPAPPGTDQSGAARGQSGDELAAVRRECDELRGKLAAERQAAAKFQQDFTGIRSQLRQNVLELGRQKSNLQKQTAELAAAKEAVEQAQKALKDKEASLGQLSEKVTRLQRDRDDLNGKLTAEQQATARSRKDIAALQLKAAELERAKADLQHKCAEQTRAASEAHEKLSAANKAGEQARTALKESEARCDRLDGELSALRRETAELRGKLTSQEQAAGESRRQIEELQQMRRESIAELERIEAERKRQSTDWAQAEAELRQQLEAANATAAQAQKAFEETETRCRQLDEAAVGLRQEGEELRGELTAAQQTSAESSRQTERLRERLEQKSAELESVKTDLDRALAERERSESELRGQVRAANETAAQAQKAFDETEIRCRQLDDELTGLQQKYDELRRKVVAERQASAETSREMAALQEVLQQRTAELESAKADLLRALAEREQSESELREQVNAATERAAQAQKAVDETETRRRQLDEESAGLRRECDDLRGKFVAEQQASAQTIREMEELLHQRAGEHESVKADLLRVLAERERADSALREQLATATETAAQAQKAFDARDARCRQLDDELAGSRRECDELRDKLAAEQQVTAKSRPELEALQRLVQQRTGELESVKADLQRIFAERERSDSDLRGQLNAANELAARAQKALDDKEAQCRQLGEEATGLRQECGKLRCEFVTEQQASAKSRQEIEAVQWVLQQKNGELESAKADLERALAERQRVESELREQLNTANETAAQARKAFDEKEKRCRQLDDDGIALRQECGELRCQLVTEQQVSVKSTREIEALQWVLQQKNGELESIKAELQRLSAERERSESDLRNQLNAANETIARGLTVIDEKENRCRQLSDEIAGLQQLRSELERKPAPEPPAAAADHEDVAEIERPMESTTAVESVNPMPETSSDEPARSASEPQVPAATENVPCPPQGPVEETVDLTANTDAAQGQMFRLTAPGARTVLLAGDFTKWDQEAIAMQNETEGVWTATVNLAPGTYHYRFVIDGKWQPDPDCEFRATNPFGGHDSVRHVG